MTNTIRETSLGHASDDSVLTDTEAIAEAPPVKFSTTSSGPTGDERPDNHQAITGACL